MTTVSSVEMFVSRIFFCVLLAVTGINGKPPSAIVRGDRAGEKEFPYTVGLMVSGDRICGGAIIDTTHILTAGHCLSIPGVNPTENMVIVSGSIDIRNGTQHRIKKVKVHENYLPNPGYGDDIAVVTLLAPIEFNDKNKAVALPTEDTPGNIHAIASGWGDLFYPNIDFVTKKLWKLDMQVMTNNECKIPRATIRDVHLCAKSKMGSGLCEGDSGGPLVSDGVIVGIASFVVPCGRGYPDVFTRVYRYLDWIKEALKD